MNLAEAQTRMLRILMELTIRPAGLFLYDSRQPGEGPPEPRCGVGGHSRSGSSGCVKPARCSASASSASRINADED